MPHQKSIYFDNAASTPVDPRVLKTMSPYFFQDFANASSLHRQGLKARVAVDRAQAQIAQFLSCEKGEIYFTSGATESDNMAIFGLIGGFKKASSVHVITSAIEHDAILEPCRFLEKLGARVTYLPVGNDGLVKVVDLKKAIRPETVLVSIMAVNNEIGTIQPIKEIGEVIKQENKKAGRQKNKIYFHTDATQALPYVELKVDELGVDALSLSGHKIYGPKGVGALYLRSGVKFAPMIFGGHQQENVRPGTYNVAGIVGLGKAVELLNKKTRLRQGYGGQARKPAFAKATAGRQENKRIKSLRDYLIREIKKKIAGVLVNGSLVKRAPSNANFIFKGVEGESVLLMLSQKGIAVSTGSACSSGSLNPSHVLLALGLKPELAHGSLRVSLGRFNNKKEVDYFLKQLPPIIAKLRKMSPLK